MADERSVYDARIEPLRGFTLQNHTELPISTENRLKTILDGLARLPGKSLQDWNAVKEGLQGARRVWWLLEDRHRACGTVPNQPPGRRVLRSLPLG